MGRLTIATSVVGLLLVMAGCSGDEQHEPSSNKPDGPAAIATDPTDGSGNHLEALGGSTLAFDEPAEYDDGLSIKLSEPEEFVPSTNATTGAEENYVKFTLHLVNGSDRKITPAAISVTVESRGGQAGDVIDQKHQMSGPPTKTVKPGGRTAWVQGFGVLDPTDLRVFIHAGRDRVPMAFSQ